MADIINFPKKEPKALNHSLVEVLVRALALNDKFLSIAIGEGAFSKIPNADDTVLDLLDANKVILQEARRKL